MSKAPIALITLDYPPEKGGVARYLGNLVEAAGGEIDVFVNKTHPSTGPGNVEAIDFLRAGRIPWWPLVSFSRQLKQRGYKHIFVSHLLPAGTAAWIARSSGGLPYSVLIHGLDLRLARSHWRKRKITKYVLQGAAHVLVNSQFVADEVLEFDHEVHPTIISPGAEAIVFPEKSVAQAQLGLSGKDWIILVVTRLIARKGIDTLIQVLATLPEHAKLVIVGDGQDRERLQALATPVKDRVQFVLDASDEERNAWYAAADCFAMPVREEGVDVEGFGIVYLEAALAGLPVIVGKSGGAPETIIDGKTGFAIDSDRPESLREKLLWLMEHPAEAQQMGQTGRARVLQNFQWSERWQQLRAKLLS